MKILFLSLFVAAFAAVAQEQKPKPQRPVNKELRQQLLAKYDADKNGVLSKEEREKISEEDRKKIREAGLGRPRGDKPPGDKPPGPKPPRAPHNKD